MIRPKVENMRSANDIAIIVISWTVLSYHTSDKFSKDVMSNWRGLYESDCKAVMGILSSRPWDFCLVVYREFVGKCELMAYLFFIGGMNSFSSLQRKTEWEYKKERFHRLIIPALFLMWVTNVLNCFALARFGTKLFSSEYASTYLSFWKLHPSHGWFLIYMYVYAQLMISSFLKWHPNHEDGEDKRFSIIPQTSHKFKELMNKMLLGPIKLVFIPAIMLVTRQILLESSYLNNTFPNHNRMENLHVGFWNDWRFHIKYVYLYTLGFTLMSLKSVDLDLILKRYGRVYLFCGIVLLLINISLTTFGCDWIGDPYSKEVEYTLSKVTLSFGQWMYMIGIYATLDSISIGYSKIIKFLREMSMPFYLLHLEVIWVLRTTMPDHSISLDKLLTIMIIATLVTGACSFLVVISPGIVRYFFGLPPTEKAFLGQWVRGYGPLAVLIFIRIIESIVGNYEV